MINEAAPQAEPDPDATAGAEAASAAADAAADMAAGTAAAVERLFGEYHFPAGPRRILLAAATAFAERGFHATTTRDIAAQAGLSSAALYFYFRSKEEVLYQIAASALDFTIEVAATEANGPWIADRAPDEPSPSPHHLAHLQQPGRPCRPVPDRRAHH